MVIRVSSMSLLKMADATYLNFLWVLSSDSYESERETNKSCVSTKLKPAVFTVFMSLSVCEDGCQMCNCIVIIQLAYILARRYMDCMRGA